MSNNFERWDHELIYKNIPYGASILDLGCGDGELLARLIYDKGVIGQGIEKDSGEVIKSISRGTPVFHADIDEGLAELGDKSFDYVILEKTLQAVHKPLYVLQEMLRVGKTGIVSFPNFGHKDVVKSLFETGRMPVTGTLPYHWFDTPNIHLFTVLDFLDWAESSGVTIIDAVSYINGQTLPFEKEHSTLAEELLFILSK